MIASTYAEPDRALLRCVVDSLEGRICIVDASGRILGANRGWAGCEGETSSTEENVYAALDVIAAPHGDLLRPVLRAVLEQGAPAASTKYTRESGDRVEWFVMRVHAVNDDERAHAVISLVNITQGCARRPSSSA